VPSGIVHPHTIAVLGAGMVINPVSLLREIETLEQAGIEVTPQRLRISTAAHLITPAHLALDALQESRRGERQLGTTRRGIGPAYTDKAARRGLRAGQMEDPERFGLEVLQHMQEALERLAHAQADAPLMVAHHHGDPEGEPPAPLDYLRHPGDVDHALVQLFPIVLPMQVVSSHVNSPSPTGGLRNA
jgi:adenylosuccinate synthase